MRFKGLVSATMLMALMGLLVSVVVAEDEKKDGPPDSIIGTVVLDGKATKPKKLNPAADPFCQKYHAKEPIVDESVITGKDNGLANVFVSVTGGLEKKDWPTPTEPVELAQHGCRYVPHVFGVMKDQTLIIKNDDSTNHNVHGLPEKNKEFNKSQAKRGMKDEFKFDKLEDFIIKCDVHAWMSSHCHVMEHPFFATTDENGKFAIKGLPDGKYELTFWHESGTEIKKEDVEVKDGKATDLDKIEFKIEKKRRPRSK